MGSTLAEKVWQQHVVRSAEGEPDLLYIDLHLLHEVTSPQAFDGLRLAGRTVRRTDLTLATEDHNVPTVNRAGGIAGLALSSWLKGGLGGVGASLVLLVLAIASAPLVFTFSWLRVMDQIGGMLLRLGPLLRRGVMSVAAPERVAPPAFKTTDAPVTPAPSALAASPTAGTAPRSTLQKKGMRVAPTLSPDGAEVPPPEAFELTSERDEAPPPVSVAAPSVAKAVVAKPVAKAHALDDVPPYEGDPLPPITLLDRPRVSGKRYTPDELEQLARDVERHLASFGVKVDVVDATPGPVITRFEIEPAA